jgi:hypothetical protein
LAFRLLLGVPARKLRRRAGGEDLEDGLHQQLFPHGLVIDERQMTYHPTGRIENRDAQVALCSHGGQYLVLRKRCLHVVRVQAHLSIDDDVTAGGARQRKLIGVSERVVRPERELTHPDRGVVHALGNEGVAHAQEPGEVTHERAEERLAGKGGGRLGDAP